MSLLKELINEDMASAMRVQRHRSSPSAVNPRLQYSEEFLRAKKTIAHLSHLLDRYSKEDSSVDAWGKYGDMAHLADELEKLIAYLRH